LMDRIGVVETLVIRIVAEPPADELRKDPLLVWTNGFPELPIDRNAFKGDIPQIPGLRLVENMRAEEMRKLYTYNACHAALAYLGALRGHERIVDCLADPVVRADAEGVLNEASLALQIEYGFSPGEMDMWNADVIDRTNNPTLGDTVTRYGADPRRKLKRADRLVGPTLLARKHNLDTRYLVRAIAAGFLFQSPDDEGAAYVQERIKTAGLEATISEVCELSPAEGDLVRETAVAFQRLSLEKKWAELAVQAERLGFEYEKTYHGCGQCCLAAILETIDHFDNAVFEAATGLSGGLGQAGDGTCGALMAGALAIGLTYPRRRSFFDGDRANKYRTFDMIQRLRQRYLDAYGGLTCHSVHRSIAGRAYDLRDAEEGKAFEAAGAHDDKCTNVVARAARWTVEIIGQELIEDQISSEPPGEGE
jgi:hypothetical protein